MKPFQDCHSFPDVEEAILERCASQELRGRIKKYLDVLKPTAVAFQLGEGTAHLNEPVSGNALAAGSRGVVLITRYIDPGDGQTKQDTVFFELVHDQILQLIPVNERETDFISPPTPLHPPRYH